MDYYIAINNEPRGPYSPEQLLAEGLQAHTLVWRAGMGNWAAAGSVPELAALLPPAAPLPPQPPPLPPMGYSYPGSATTPGGLVSPFYPAHYPPRFAPAAPPELAQPPVPPRRFPVGGWVCWILILGLLAFLLGGARVMLKNTELVKKAEARESRGNPLLGFQSKVMLGSMQVAKGSVSAKQAESFEQSLQEQAYSPEDRLHAAIVKLELQQEAGSSDPDDAADTMSDLAAEFHKPELRVDANLFALAYRDGNDSLTAEQQDGLIARHRWFAQLALGYQADSPLRNTALQSAKSAFFLGVGLMMGVLLLGVVGLVLAIIALVNLRKILRGYRASVWGTATQPVVAESQPYGSTWLQSFTVYLLVFFALSIAIELTFPKTPLALDGLIALLAGSLLFLFPRLTGRRGADIRRALGWHKGRGIFREIGAGFVGYLAGLPLIVIGMIASLIVAGLVQQFSGSGPTSGPAEPPMIHPIVYAIGGSRLTVFLLFVLACIVAPLVEETAFRGAFYHHMRQRHGVFLSAILVGFVFAAIHPQGWMAIPALGAVAVVLALIREWRGSIIASMTAHALFNAGTMTFMLLALR